MSLGDVLLAYSNEVKRLGYNENAAIDQDDYAPMSKANKSFYLQGVGKDGEPLSGNTEDARQRMRVTVLLAYRAGTDFALDEQANWNLVDALERALFAFSAGRKDSLKTLGMSGTRIGNFKRFEIELECQYSRSLAV